MEKEQERDNKRRQKQEQTKLKLNTNKTSPRERGAGEGLQNPRFFFGPLLVSSRGPRVAPKGPQRPQTTPNAAFCLSRGTFWVGRGLWEPPWVNEKTPGEGTNAGFLGVSTPSPAQGTPGPNTPE